MTLAFFFTGLPVSRYQLFWSMRLDVRTKKYVAIEVKDRHTMGNTTECTINGLLPNTTYLLELKAMTRWRRRNLRSRRVTIRIRTPSDNAGKILSQEIINIIIRCKSFFLFIGGEPTTWPTNNGVLMRNVVELFLAANTILLMRKWNHVVYVISVIILLEGSAR